MSRLTEWRKHIEGAIWKSAPERLPLPQAAAIRLARLLWVLIRDIATGQLTLHAMSLVYTTLLSLVPLLAFSFSVLKGLGVHNRLEPLLYNTLMQIGPRGEEFAQRVMGFVDNVRADVLGSVGLALLIYLIISLVQKMEDSFNYVWRVEKPRSFARRFSNYLTVILIGPLFVTVAISITATVTSNEVVKEIVSIEPFGTLMLVASRLLPYLIAIGVFTFMYAFVPNTRVRVWPALVGGIVAGTAWQTAGWLFATFIAGSSNYVAIYSSFAIMLTFMIWLYLNWLILLIGALVSFYVQNPRFVTRSALRQTISGELRECLAMEIMYRVADAYHDGSNEWDIERLSIALNVPADELSGVTGRLERAGLLLVTEGPESRFVPGRDIDNIPLEMIRAAVRRADPVLDHDESNVPISEAVREMRECVEEAVREQLVGITLRDVVRKKRFPRSE